MNIHYFYFSICSSINHEVNFQLNHSSSFVRGGFGRVSSNTNVNVNNSNNNGPSSKTPSECYNCIEEMSFSSAGNHRQHRRREAVTPSPTAGIMRKSTSNTPPIQKREGGSVERKISVSVEQNRGRMKDRKNSSSSSMAQQQQQTEKRVLQGTEIFLFLLL